MFSHGVFWKGDHGCCGIARLSSPSGKPLPGAQGADSCHLGTCPAQPGGQPGHVTQAETRVQVVCAQELWLGWPCMGLGSTHLVLVQVSDLHGRKPVPSHCGSLSLPFTHVTQRISSLPGNPFPGEMKLTWRRTDRIHIKGTLRRLVVYVSGPSYLSSSLL